MLFEPYGLMDLYGFGGKHYKTLTLSHSTSRRFAKAVLTNRRCSLCARAGRWSSLTLKPSRPWGRLSRWRCMVPFRDACNMAKAQWMKIPTTDHCRRLWEAMWTCTRRVMCLWFAIALRQGMTTAPWHCSGLIARDFVYTNIIARSLLFLGFCVGGVELILWIVTIFVQNHATLTTWLPGRVDFEALRFFLLNKLIYYIYTCICILLWKRNVLLKINGWKMYSLVK